MAGCSDVDDNDDDDMDDGCDKGSAVVTMLMTMTKMTLIWEAAKDRRR